MKKEFRDILKEKNRTKMPNVLLASAECAPLSKTGGLADVVGTLPKALASLETDARVITPYHRMIKEKYGEMVEHLFSIRCYLGWRNSYVGVERLVLDGVIVYLIDNEQYFGDRIYYGGYPEGEQYSFFCRAVMEVLPLLDFVPDIVHCNDWHTAMLPMLAKTQYAGRMQDKPRYLLTIHNIAFQGKFDFEYVQDLLGIDPKYYTAEFMELYGCANYLKAGCVFADRINTVSPTYADEIRTPYFSEGLDGILNARAAQLSGIINGIDAKVFDPHGDPLLPANYDSAHMKGKTECKAELQKRMGLDRDPAIPVIAMVTRMTEQKGFDLVASRLDRLINGRDVEFMLLGTGEARYEDFMRAAEARHKGRVCAYIGYNEELAHLVYAGSNYYLMPSRFEPCGLSQMIAMRYGTVPIVRETGGLRDTVKPYNCFTGEGNGFSFANYNADEMYDTILYALGCCSDKKVMRGLISHAMGEDFSFDRSAEEYARLYLCML